MPRVLLDLRMVQGRLHGIARYALELARALPTLEPRWEFQALTPPQGLGDVPPMMRPAMPLIRARAGFLSPFEQAALWADLSESRCDLFHATSFSLPAFWQGPLVATLHDANHLALATEYGIAQRLYYRTVVHSRLPSAAQLITVSAFSQRELSRYLGVAPERWNVIPLGVDPGFRPSTPEEMAAFRRSVAVPARYFVAIGNTKTYKNLSLLTAIASRLPVPLVIVAGISNPSGHPNNTLLLDRLEEQWMSALLTGATALLLPSFYEGFGLPVLEAMACGTPVIASNTSSLPEVAGDAAILVDPSAPETWLREAQRLHDDPALHQKLSTAGQKRAAGFRWHDCAEQTLAVYRKALPQ